MNEKVERLKEVLRNENGIHGEAEFKQALKSFKGIDLGLFITPLPGGRANEHTEDKITA